MSNPTNTAAHHLTNNATWKPIAGYEDLYEVSDTGLIRRVPRSPAYPKGFRILAPWMATTGYPCVSLYRDGIARKFKLHRLVAIAFLEQPEGAADVCHNDGNRTNARLDNLRWDTKSGNMRDMTRHGTQYNQFRDRTHCTNGHPFDQTNTLIAADGRKCRTCRRNRVRAWRARQKDQASA